MNFFPFAELESNPNVTLLQTEFGGHVGFVDFGHKYFWSERCLVEFFQD
jgi:predicted alpha/beta-fold hydrolase